MVLFMLIVVRLGRGLKPGPWKTGIIVATLAGAVASLVQFGVDIVVGMMAASKDEMRALSGEFTSVPGMELVFYQVGPMLVFPWAGGVHGVAGD
jgi:hypothetical protein